MKSSAKKIELASVDDLFSTEEGRQDAKLEKIQEIPLSELHPFRNHPFKVKDDEAMMETADSIKQYGVLVPAIARPDPEGGYELVAGHRRHRASELAEKETMPVIVRDLDDDAATIIMVDSNLQRESLLPSERAFAYSDDESPLSLKSDFILSLCELIVGGKEGLQPVQKTIIDRCVRLVYNEYLNDPKPENMPILEDLYNLLREQEEKEAQYIATALEIYVTGSLNVFNHQSNVDIDNRIVCYDIKELGKQLKKIGMLVVQDQVWNRVTINRAAHKSTRYYIDEMHLLLKEEQTAAYTVEIWKRFRKWGGIPTGITQNVKDLLSSREVENIFENSDFVYMLNQAGGDRQILAKQLGISTHQLSYVTHSGEGEGLLFYGSTILPFVDHFPKNTELYRIMTTKPQELKKEDE